MLDRPRKGNSEGDSVAFLFALLADFISGLVESGAGGPEMCRVLWGGVAESAQVWDQIYFRSVSSEPSVACDELDEFTESRATEFSQSRVSVHAGEPLLGLGSVWLRAVGCG